MGKSIGICFLSEQCSLARVYDSNAGWSGVNSTEMDEMCALLGCKNVTVKTLKTLLLV